MRYGISFCLNSISLRHSNVNSKDFRTIFDEQNDTVNATHTREQNIYFRAVKLHDFHCVFTLKFEIKLARYRWRTNITIFSYKKTVLESLSCEFGCVFVISNHRKAIISATQNNSLSKSTRMIENPEKKLQIFKFHGKKCKSLLGRKSKTNENDILQRMRQKWMWKCVTFTTVYVVCNIVCECYN